MIIDGAINVAEINSTTILYAINIATRDTTYDATCAATGIIIYKATSIEVCHATYNATYNATCNALKEIIQ